MKYKIGKYVIDAKSPIKAHQSVKLIKQHTKQYLKDAYDIKEGAIFKQLKPLSDGRTRYLKIMKIDNNNTITFNVIYKDAHSGQYYSRDTYYLSANNFKRNILAGMYKQVNSLYDSKVKDATSSIEHIKEYFRVWGAPSRGELQDVVNYYRLSKDDVKKIFGNRFNENDLTNLKYYDSKVKDYKPPFAVWVKENGKWKIYSGSNFANVDRNAFLAKGYEDVKVVKNGDDVKDSKVKNETFDKSIKDSFAILHPHKFEFLSVGGKTWVKEDSSMIQKFATENEAIEFGRKHFNENFRIFKFFNDSVKDSYSVAYKIKDEAFDRQTIEALITDEQAAIDSYNVAIANLKGKLSDEAIKVLQAIRDDEQNHVANLNAILSNNITEKNLEDAITDVNNFKQGDVVSIEELSGRWKIISIINNTVILRQLGTNKQIKTDINVLHQ